MSSLTGGFTRFLILLNAASSLMFSNIIHLADHAAGNRYSLDQHRLNVGNFRSGLLELMAHSDEWTRDCQRHEPAEHHAAHEHRAASRRKDRAVVPMRRSRPTCGLLANVHAADGEFEPFQLQIKRQSGFVPARAA